MNPAEAAPADAAARERAVMHPGSVLVQAPAGSGKTTLLVRRFLRVLATVDAPDGVLALTFTRRAAYEMRARITAAIEEARGALGGAPGPDPSTRRLASDAVRHFDGLNIDLAAQSSRLRVETIDAFNAWLAGRLPVGSGLGALPRVADDASQLYREAARRSLAHAPDDAFGAALEHVLELFDQRHEALVELLAGMLPNRERWLPLLAGGLRVSVADEETELPAVRRRFEEDLTLLAARSLRQASALIGAERLTALAAPLRAAAARAGGAIPALAAWSERGGPLLAEPSDLPRWRAFIAVALTRAGALRTRLTAAEGFPPDMPEKRAMRDLLEELGGDPRVALALADVAALPGLVYEEADWGRVRDVARLLVLAAAELEQVFRERGAVDFPAVSIAAMRALGEAQAPTDLALRLDYRLRHVLIDEFQDTSGAQLDLLALLTAGWQADDGRSVFCVGDPMQSIYGFRQAEVRAFLELAERGLADLPFAVERLSDNFRAAPGLVAWVNTTFSRVLPAHDDRERGAIAFRPSRAARAELEDDSPAVATALFESRASEAAAVAEWIAARRARHPSWQIAVLVRARSHGGEIAARLRSRGVEFRAVDLEPLAERPVARDLIMLARALMHLGDRIAWFAVLRAPWAGIELADLLAIGRGAPSVWQGLGDPAVLALLTPDGRRRCERLRGVLGAAFAARAQTRFSRRLERTWLALGGPACCAGEAEQQDARAVFARCRELERQGGADPAEFAARFANRPSAAAGRAAVEIMTIHKAKGLEFDMVVVPGLDRAVRHRNEEILLSLQFARTGREGMLMAARPAIGADADPLFEFLRRMERDGAQLEAERLLYVACTRAKRELRLAALGDGSTRPRAGSLLATLWPIVGEDFVAAPREPAVEGVDAAPAGATAGRIAAPVARVPAHWTPPALAAAAATAPPPPVVPLRTAAPPFDWAGETARQVGILVHAQLRALDPAAATGAFSAREPQFRRWLGAHGVPREWLADASRRAVAALEAVRADPRARWILAAGRRDDLREHALSGLVGGELIHVVLDRSFVDEDGVRWVIDYKTGEHRGGGEAAFLDREVERYRPQLERYAALVKRLGPEPVRLGLYFPLLRAWREWQAP